MTKNPFHALDILAMCQIVDIALSCEETYKEILKETDLDSDALFCLSDEIRCALDKELLTPMSVEEFIGLVNSKDSWTGLTMPIEEEWLEEEGAPYFLVRKAGEFLSSNGLDSLAERIKELSILVKSGNDAALIIGQMVNVELA